MCHTGVSSSCSEVTVTLGMLTGFGNRNFEEFDLNIACFSLIFWISCLLYVSHVFIHCTLTFLRALRTLLGRWSAITPLSRNMIHMFSRLTSTTLNWSFPHHLGPDKHTHTHTMLWAQIEIPSHKQEEHIWVRKLSCI